VYKRQHIVLAYPGGTDGNEKLYVDGTLCTNENKTLNLWPDDPINVGASLEGDLVNYSKWFSGSLASVQIYGEELTQGQIQILVGGDSSTPTPTRTSTRTPTNTPVPTPKTVDLWRLY